MEIVRALPHSWIGHVFGEAEANLRKPRDRSRVKLAIMNHTDASLRKTFRNQPPPRSTLVPPNPSLLRSATSPNMSDSSPTAVKARDTYPPPQNLAVRVSTRQLDGLKIHPSPSSNIVDDLDHPSSSAADDVVNTTTASVTHRGSSSSSSPSTSNGSIGSNGNGLKSVSAPRHLCMRHQRTADEGTNLKLQEVCWFFCSRLSGRGVLCPHHMQLPFPAIDHPMAN